jgi:hypothetical protein
VGHDELRQARRTIKELHEELRHEENERLDDTRRRASLCAEELLTCAATLAGHPSEDRISRNELEIALAIVRRRAEERWLLQRRTPRSAQ